jgi:D-beta-D-heptose 7-phosphate kinase/D-beta-D-heptose 1-phosphate adenosyltransferase
MSGDASASLAAIRAAHAAGRKIVFTNGCFDLLHAGHVALLEEAAGLGDFLVVGMNSDASVRRLKGWNRPYNSEEDRRAVLAAIRHVDAVVIFDEETPLRLITEIRPDVLVKGADYGEGEIVGADEVRSWGGVVHRVALLAGRSTSGLSERMKDENKKDES